MSYYLSAWLLGLAAGACLIALLYFPARALLRHLIRLDDEAWERSENDI